MRRSSAHLGLCRVIGVMVLTAIVLATASCGAGARWPLDAQNLKNWTLDRWANDFENAERRCSEQGKPMLIVYRSGDKKRDKPIDRALLAASIQACLEPFVRCDLFRTCEADRRYAAQFGVERPGSMMIVHQDGTYHARLGVLTVQDIESFLAEATPPGVSPKWNPNIARRAVYDWQTSLAAALATARKTGQSVVHVVQRRLSGDAQKLDKLFATPEVSRRMAGLLTCRTNVWNPLAKTFDTPKGPVKLPAIVLIRPNGSDRVLELPRSSQAIVDFLDTENVLVRDGDTARKRFGAIVRP